MSRSVKQGAQLLELCEYTSQIYFILIILNIIRHIKTQTNIIRNMYLNPKSRLSTELKRSTHQSND